MPTLALFAGPDGLAIVLEALEAVEAVEAVELVEMPKMVELVELAEPVELALPFMYTDSLFPAPQLPCGVNVRDHI